MQLSVLIITYNQSKFIEQAVLSALVQQTALETEIVVADDGSTDGTREIVEQLVSSHPSRVRLVSHDHHVGVQQNFLDGYSNCDGQYLALLTGDDYWISPYKLQRQATFLDRHAECSICFHNVLIVHEDRTPETLACGRDRKEFSGLEDLLIENFIPVSSVMYRHGIIREFPAWSRALMTWDWALNLFHAQYGRAGYLDDTMAVGRSQACGIWTGASSSARIEATMAMLEHVNRHFGGKYDAVIRASIQRWQSVRRLDELHVTFKQLEAEWHRHLEGLQLDRTASVNQLRIELRELERDREHLTREVHRLSSENSVIAAQKELALREISELRSQTTHLRSALLDLTTALERNASREESVSSETLRGLSAVDQQLREIYRWMDVQRTKELLQTCVPPGSTVLIVSKGDAEYLKVEGLTGWHFPRTENGTYAGSHPADGQDATDQLEALRREGAEYIAFPGSSLWWLDHYAEFRQHLEQMYHAVLNREGACVIFSLAEKGAAAGHIQSEEGVAY